MRIEDITALFSSYSFDRSHLIRVDKEKRTEHNCTEKFRGGGQSNKIRIMILFFFFSTKNVSRNNCFYREETRRKATMNSSITLNRLCPPPKHEARTSECRHLSRQTASLPLMMQRRIGRPNRSVISSDTCASLQRHRLP